MSEIIASGAQFSPTVVSNCLSLLLHDPDLNISIIRPQHFVDPLYEEIASCVLDYRHIYHQCPSPQALELALEQHFQPENAQDDYPIEILAQALSVVSALPDLALDNSIEFFRHQFVDFARTQRINQALQLKDQYLANGQHLQFAQMMVDAASGGQQAEVQTIDLWNFQSWFEKAQWRREGAIQTLFPTLDHYLEGLMGGELITVVAPPSGGKTRFLLSLADSCRQQGKDALVLSVEEEEWRLCMRMAMRLLGQSKEELLAHPETTEARFRSLSESSNRSTIRFARFTPSISSIVDLQSYYKNVYLSQYRPPGLILVDYADKLAPARQREHYRFELGDTYLALFSWAIDLGLPIVTASQTSMEGMDRKLLTMRDLGESISKAAISDIVLTLNNSEETPDITRVYIAKNRTGVAFHSATLAINPVTQDLEEVGSAE